MDDVTRVLGRPPHDTRAAERLASELWGIAAEARELASDRDRNFHLKGVEGEWVLKVANSRTRPSVLETECRVLESLRERIVLRVPRPVRSRTGQLVETISADGEQYPVRVVGYLPGALLADVHPRPAAFLHALGAGLGQLDLALIELDLSGFEGELDTDHPWDLAHAERTITRHVEEVGDRERRRRLERILSRVRERVDPALRHLPRSRIHNDANDHNVLVRVDALGCVELTGLIDFGDMVESATLGELAVAMAYLFLGESHPLDLAGPLVAGYHSQRTLGESELELLYDLVIARLGLSVAMAAHQSRLEPDNPYLRVSEARAWDTLERLESLPSALATATFRHACGLEPVPVATRLRAWQDERAGTFVSLLAGGAWSPVRIDLTPDSPLTADLGLPIDQGRLAERVEETLSGSPSRAVGIGAWDEARLLYVGDQFKGEGEPRTIHLGVDLFAPAGTPVLAPLDGEVVSLADNAAAFDYGPTVILRHTLADSEGSFEAFTLYGHLSRETLESLVVGQRVAAGEVLARLGAIEVNGGWAPHLHFQWITDRLGLEGNFPGVAAPRAREIWHSISPDPSAVLGVDCRAERREASVLGERRQRMLGPNLSLSYSEPLVIVRGYGARLYDANAQSYLDLVNNVAHVGHAHPRVVEAAARQARILETNTRYLSPVRLRYVERLLATFPEPLSVCYLVCTGSEANDLALRLARASTGRESVITLEGAYHGHTRALIDVSPYKHDGPGGGGTPPGVFKVPLPDLYRGRHRRGLDGLTESKATECYVDAVARAVEDAAGESCPVAAFLAESLPGCGGQIELPEGYLEGCYETVRRGGGVCIADEVQVGFGRVGTAWWAFELQGVVPDIVTLGKPIGNGHPMAAVITTREIADAFDNGMEYFNTFGGNPVSCAVGEAVLDVVESEGLRDNARRLGERLKRGLREIGESHPTIGDVRGQGLFLGIELVRSKTSREPAPEAASYLVESMKRRGFLLSSDGPDHNVIKIKPPLVIDEADVDALLNALESVLAETPMRNGPGVVD